MTPCHTCKAEPHFINGKYGITYECSRCKRKTLSWADNEAAMEDWEAMNNPDTMPHTLLRAKSPGFKDGVIVGPTDG